MRTAERVGGRVVSGVDSAREGRVGLMGVVCDCILFDGIHQHLKVGATFSLGFFEEGEEDTMGANKRKHHIETGGAL